MTAKASRALAWLPLFLPWETQATPLEQTEETEEGQQRHRAFHGAYCRFAQRYPDWVNQRFDETFLRQALQLWLGYTGTVMTRNQLPSSHELAWAWDRQFGPLFTGPQRTRSMAELTRVATDFLYLLQQAVADQSARA
ncbi:MAG: hypothetical protein KF832_21325 [Caldilineaceae bacterium]|nr:hypothetical protein [Caldilineaceae bacterium]